MTPAPTIGAITACSIERVLDGSLARLVTSANGQVAIWTVVVHGAGDVEHELDALIPSGIHCIRRARASLSEARNLALKDWATRDCIPDVVCFPDDDCLFEARTLPIIVERFTSPTVDVLLGAYAPVIDRLDRRRFPEQPRVVDAEFLIRSSSSITIFARTSMVMAAGGFDERLGAGASVPAGEDVDLVLRLHRHDARFRYEPTALMRHEYKCDTGLRYHPHAAALLVMHAFLGSAPIRIAIRSVGALLIRVLGRRYSAAALGQFARSGGRLCVSTRRGLP